MKPVIMLPSSLAAQIKADNAALFSAALHHPFVQGIGDGSLPKAQFTRWIVQDWLYLQSYLQTLAQASPSLGTVAYMQTLQAAWGNYPAIVATLTPCAVGYAQIACSLHANNCCGQSLWLGK